MDKQKWNAHLQAAHITKMRKGENIMEGIMLKHFLQNELHEMNVVCSMINMRELHP